MCEYGYYLDIMAVSCDSFNEKINEKIGRSAKVWNLMYILKKKKIIRKMFYSPAIT